MPSRLDRYLKEMEQMQKPPQVGSTVRIESNDTEGKVVKVTPDGTVFFKTPDGRTMKTSFNNVTAVEKLADEDFAMMEGDEKRLKDLGKLKTLAGEKARKADKEGDTETGNKMFGKIIKATNAQFDIDAKKAKEREEAKKKDVSESKYEYDKKSGSMKQNNEDSDQRHGLYIDGKLVKTYSTKEQADNVKKRDPKFKSATVKKIAEGSMGGINRCAPSNDVSYEKVLDEVKKKWIEETSVQKLEKYQTAAASSSALNTRPLFKLAQTAKIAPIVKQKVDLRRGVTQGPAVPAGSLAERLEYFLDEAFDANAFADILNKQKKDSDAVRPRAKIVEIPVKRDNGTWIIKYRPASVVGEKVPYSIHSPTGEMPFKGEAYTAKDAIRSAEEWIVSGGGGSDIVSSSSVAIDFNAVFAKTYARDGEPFYCDLEKYGNDVVLIFSNRPQDGLKKTHLRNRPGGVSGSAASLPMISISPKKAASLGLQAHGRYTLLKQVDDDDKNSDYFMLKLEFHSKVQGKGDLKQLKWPALTVATPN